MRFSSARPVKHCPRSQGPKAGCVDVCTFKACTRAPTANHIRVHAERTGSQSLAMYCRVLLAYAAGNVLVFVGVFLYDAGTIASNPALVLFMSLLVR
jgi:hypothetical protein